MRVIILKDYVSKSGIKFLKGQEAMVDLTTSLELADKKIIKTGMAPRVENAMQQPDFEERIIKEKKNPGKRNKAFKQSKLIE